MEVSRALTTVIFSGKVGGRGISLCNIVKGAVLHHLGGEQQHESCFPLPYIHGGQQPPWLPKGVFPKGKKGLGLFPREGEC